DFAHDLDVLYLTIDLDVLPAAVAPGVSAPAGLGVETALVAAAVRAAAATGTLALLDVVELNPALDIDGRTARTAARLVDLAVHRAVALRCPGPPCPRPHRGEPGRAPVRSPTLVASRPPGERERPWQTAAAYSSISTGPSRTAAWLPSLMPRRCIGPGPTGTGSCCAPGVRPRSSRPRSPRSSMARWPRPADGYGSATISCRIGASPRSWDAARSRCSSATTSPSPWRPLRRCCARPARRRRPAPGCGVRCPPRAWATDCRI